MTTTNSNKPGKPVEKGLGKRARRKAKQEAEAAQVAQEPTPEQVVEQPTPTPEPADDTHTMPPPPPRDNEDDTVPPEDNVEQPTILALPQPAPTPTNGIEATVVSVPTTPAKKPPVNRVGGLAAKGGLTMQGARVLKALRESKMPLTRKMLKTRCGGQSKGWSKLFGATSREHGSKGLVHLGYCTLVDVGGGLAYSITQAGLDALTAHELAEAQTVQPKEEGEVANTQKQVAAANG